MDELLRLEGVEIGAGGRELARDVAWTVRRGERWALWGPNGAGKTTLLALLAGARDARAGVVRRTPGVRVRIVDQAASLPDVGDLGGAIRAGLHPVRDAERALRAEERLLASGAGDLGRYGALQEAFERAGGYRAEGRLRRAVEELLPDLDDGAELGALSDGERRRLALALALADRPDLLLLDEPTNGLDAQARRWAGERLAALPRDVGLVVASHDRALLGRVSTASARLANGRLEPVHLPFDRDRARRGTALRSAARSAQAARRERERLQGAAEQARRHGSPKRAAAARALARRAARVGAVEAPVPDSGGREPGRARHLPDSEARAGPIVRAHGLTRRGAFHDVALSFDAGQKLVVLGANGTGKSSLLAMLAGEVRSDDPRGASWLRPGARLHHWTAGRRGLASGPVRDQLAALVPEPRIPSLLTLVGLPFERWSSAAHELSGGERSRAALALLIAREPDVVLLDEPESDLDLPGIDLLEQALVEARTTVVLVTHDLRLAEAVASDVRTLEEGRLIAWRGGVDGWRHGRRRREAAGTSATTRGTMRQDDGRPGDGGRAGAGHDHVSADGTGPGDARRGHAAPADVDALEDEQAAIEALLEDPTRLGERERARLQARSAELTAARMAAYDARLPPPAPRYRATEPPLVLEADADPRDGLVFLPRGWPSAPRMRRDGDVVHLLLPEPADAAWTPWARTAALRACLGLIFPLLAPIAVQVRAGDGAAPAPFADLDDGWWVATRTAWERWSGVHDLARGDR